MGNCQAAEVATAAVLQHPGAGGRTERFHWPVTAHEIMTSNPGHYVALVAVVATPKPPAGETVAAAAAARHQLKLLRPEDSLMLGHVYCLISFEDVLKEHAAKKCVKLRKMGKQSGGHGQDYDHMKKKTKKKEFGDSKLSSSMHPKVHNFSPVQPAETGGSYLRLRGGWRQQYYGGTLGLWKPALTSIPEIGT